MHYKAWSLLAFAAFALHWQGASASGNCAVPAGRFVSVEGAVEILAAAGGSWRVATLQEDLCEGDTIRVGERSRAAVALINEAVLRIDQDTTLRLLDITGGEGERSWLELVQGAIRSFSRKPRFLTVNTPYLNGSIEGTEFAIRVRESETHLAVTEGTILASNAQGSLPVSGGEAVAASMGQPPRTIVRPKDAVQWTLYYPPIIALGGASDAAAGAPLGEAAELLSVGRVDQALPLIEKAIAEGKDAGLAYALRSVVKVTLNQRAAALADAKKAAELTDASAARIALSYALQADFQIETARDTMQAAVEQDPDDALAWARLGELELMLGRRGQALAAAQSARALAPKLARTELVLGFNALALFRNAEASAAFERAIMHDSADPLAHLGLGLSKISGGRLADGRGDLEAAVALDASNALLRSYLGKAYFEERRYPLDSQQYGIAKELDPLDPTAYLYDGILKQTINRPVEAVADLERSIELNDNRAVYRSRLLLDKDRAARGTSLARAYNDLGFEQLGINASTRSLGLDPANASAHRFLSDVYRDSGSRTEITRVSELLQAQMMQDININPVQPSISSSNLNIVTMGGPAEAGFNEFTPLFQRNKAQLNLTGLRGSNGAAGDEAVVSALFGPVSGSLGGFRYDTDGFRSNNDLSHDIWNIYSQWAVSPSLNLQAEYGYRETEHGDLRQNFDLDVFDDTFRRGLEGETWRLGARFSPTPSSDFLVSYIHSDLDTTGQTVPLKEITDFISVTVSEYQAQNDQADQFEGQYIYRTDRLNLVAGGAHSESEIDGQLTATAVITLALPIPGFPPLVFEDVQIFPTDSNTKDTRGYVYANFQLHDRVLATLGASYQSYDQELIGDGITNDFNEWNPKLGIRWEITDSLTARAAYFETVKPVLVSNRTLEPTQVAGFNQFFDDPDATRSTRYGVGLDWRPLSNLRVGAELTRRDLESPVIDLTAREATYEDREERLDRLYLYWTPPGDRVSVSAEAIYDKFTNQEDLSLASGIVPDSARTWTLPISAAYFHPSGWFFGAGLTYVDQEVRRDPEQSGLPQGESQFTLVDASIGFRMPRRLGLLSVGVLNVFGQEFDYLDDSYRSFSNEPYVSPYIPERTLLGRLTLSF